MKREIALKKLTRLNRLIIYGNYDKKSVNWLKDLRKNFRAKEKI